MHIPLRGAVAPLTMPRKRATTAGSGIVAYWNLEEASGQRNDSVGANHLTDNNTVTQAVGKVGNAAQFATANVEYLSRIDNAALSVGDIDFTFAAWVKADTLVDNRGILGKWGGVGKEYALVYLSSRFGFYVQDASSVQHNVNANQLGVPTTGVWYFIVCWHDAAGDTLNIQVNDGVVDSAPHSTGVRDGANAFAIGEYQAGAGTSWNGQIDEVGFWKRVLTNAERTDLYNSGNGMTYPFS